VQLLPTLMIELLISSYMHAMLFIHDGMLIDKLLYILSSLYFLCNLMTLYAVYVVLLDDLLRYTWLYERYDASGNQIRTAYYFEYPSLVVMMLREIQYGKL